jgi:AcrR family transcriptional regulator
LPSKPLAKRPSRAAAKRARTPNVERTAAMRARIIEATIECLHERGYHQTSTLVVIEHAGVSRGAMLHHFPTKADLMIAVSEHIVTLRSEVHRTELGKLKTDRERFLHLIDTLWLAFQTPSGIARVEIMLGSRSDPEIEPRFRELNKMLHERHVERVWAQAERMGVKDKKRMRAFVALYAAALRGLAIDAIWPHSKADAKAAVALLKEFQALMLDRMLKA